MKFPFLQRKGANQNISMVTTTVIFQMIVIVFIANLAREKHEG